MATRHEDSPEHKKAHDLAEQALDKAADGDARKARDLIEEAKSIDPKIGEEMSREAAEDQKKADKYVDKTDK
ncbi:MULTISPECIES: hypothetical protein [Azospirillum]|uniref:Uncharacterized protein n=1 Tax=Azospirillum lipoferum (strain 4B) TaxID=862719 RepID=G7Z6I4_AZOL4|nr:MULTISPECIES: hypothetical protein [Azospirillum]KAA0583155.1 hypothetical protein FZ983_00570 [Azospirillum sp. B21]CBS86571.1 protein of unknown function [Azospirillum lipoferum 4B]